MAHNLSMLCQQINRQPALNHVSARPARFLLLTRTLMLKSVPLHHLAACGGSLGHRLPPQPEKKPQFPSLRKQTELHLARLRGTTAASGAARSSRQRDHRRKTLWRSERLD